jgi:hypothetical protein
MHWHQRNIERQRQRLGESNADEKRTNKTRSLSNRDRVKVTPRSSSIIDCPLYNSANIPYVLT